MRDVYINVSNRGKVEVTWSAPAGKDDIVRLALPQRVLEVPKEAFVYASSCRTQYSVRIL